MSLTQVRARSVPVMFREVASRGAGAALARKVRQAMKRQLHVEFREPLAPTRHEECAGCNR
jgi:hypothetical protein